MRLTKSGTQQRSHEQQHRRHESLVDNRIYRQHRIGAGAHVVYVGTDADVEDENQQQLPHTDAKIEQ